MLIHNASKDSYKNRCLAKVRRVRDFEFFSTFFFSTPFVNLRRDLREIHFRTGDERGKRNHEW